jgi:formylglycine-generating enzyme required for sulfatase activity
VKVDKSNLLIILWLAIPLGLLLGQPLLRQAGWLQSLKSVAAADSTMVEIPAGDFVMGLTVDEAWPLNQSWRNLPDVTILHPFTREVPQLKMHLNTFFIDRYEVTNAQYRRCVEAEVCPSLSLEGTSLPNGYATDPAYDQYPVRGVLWEAANSYCRWLDKRLPTEAEWEKAARGPSGWRYPWGNEWDSQAVELLQAKPAPVGRRTIDSSPYGVMDLAGNAPEWMADRFYLYPGNPAAHLHTSVAAAGAKVVRGAAYSQLLAISAMRTPMFPNAPTYPVGFRCAQGAPPLALMLSTPQAGKPAPGTHVDLAGMVYIEAGEFVMGRNDIAPHEGRSEEKPAHSIYLDSYYIDQYEVTVSDYADFLNALGGHIWRCQGYSCAWQKEDGSFAQAGLRLVEGRYEAEPGYETIPVAYVAWPAAADYCAWAGKRLPTEAEWEKAARGTDGRVYAADRAHRTEVPRVS